jgi:hypothetical protein
MRPDRDIERMLEAWLEPGASRMPDRLFDAVVDRIERVPQRRFVWTHTRTSMTPLLRFAAVAALSLVVGIGIAPLWGGHTNPASPSPSPSPSPSTAVPAELQYRWLGSLQAIPEIPARDQAFASLAFDGRSLTLDAGGSANLVSVASSPSHGLLDLSVSLANFGNVGVLGCFNGQVGRYAYSLSQGGAKLTLAAIDDGCTPRNHALLGDWLRAACQADDLSWCLGVLPAGTYASTFFDSRMPAGRVGWKPRFGALTYTVPEGWANSEDGAENIQLMKQAAYQKVGSDSNFWSNDTINLFISPAAGVHNADCSNEEQPGVPRTVDAIVNWITHHPGIVASAPEPITINGRTGKMLDIDLKPTWTRTCPGLQGPTVALLAEADGGPGGQPFGPGGTGAATDPMRLIFLDIGNGDIAFVFVDSGDPSGIDALVAEAMPIIESFKFADY